VPAIRLPSSPAPIPPWDSCVRPSVCRLLCGPTHTTDADGTRGGAGGGSSVRLSLLCFNYEIGFHSSSKVKNITHHADAAFLPVHGAAPRLLPACWPVGARGVIACVASRAWHRLCGPFFGCVYFLLCRASAWRGNAVRVCRLRLDGASSPGQLAGPAPRGGICTFRAQPEGSATNRISLLA